MTIMHSRSLQTQNHVVTGPNPYLVFFFSHEGVNFSDNGFTSTAFVDEVSKAVEVALHRVHSST
jgi:hypothetical protein